MPGIEPETHPSAVRQRAITNFVVEMIRTTAAHQTNAVSRTLYQDFVTSPEYRQMEQDQEEMYRQMEEDQETAPSHE